MNRERLLEIKKFSFGKIKIQNEEKHSGKFYNINFYLIKSLYDSFILRICNYTNFFTI